MSAYIANEIDQVYRTNGNTIYFNYCLSRSALLYNGTSDFNYRMDSIDVYLEKKRKRMEGFNQSAKRAKVRLL